MACNKTGLSQQQLLFFWESVTQNVICFFIHGEDSCSVVLGVIAVGSGGNVKCF